jgi:carboxynorspermidine decarboxylase
VVIKETNVTHTPPYSALAKDRPYFAGFSPEGQAGLKTPCFVIDRAALEYNLSILRRLSEESGASILLALKAFALPALGKQISAALAGCTASGLYEAKLARDHFGKEVHVTSPAYANDELDELLGFAHAITFNNLHQWQRVQARCLEAQRERGKKGEELRFAIRINPEHSEGTYTIYDPCAPKSRLGITRKEWNNEIDAAKRAGTPPEALLRGISGIHFHTLCEQGAAPLERTLNALYGRWEDILAHPEITWFNMGGGHHITKPDYDRALLTHLLQSAQARFSVRTYLEPGEAAAIHTGILAARVLDIHTNEVPIAILDVSAPCHMPDTLEMPYTPGVWGAQAVSARNAAMRMSAPGDDQRGQARPQAREKHTYILAGASCLAGDVMGTYRFDAPLAPGDIIIFDDMAHYTFVKTNTFNGVPLPGLALYDSRTKEYTPVRQFGYEDFYSRLA